MKKFTILLLTGLAVLNGCTSQEDPIPQFEPAERATETTYTRSVADAIALADAFLDAGNDKVESRAGRTPGVAAILGATSRSESDTLLYSVNYGEDNGFVIVSATATPQPVLAYVEKGSYDGETTQNPGFEGFIEAAKNYSTYAVTGPMDSVLKPAPRPYTIYRVAEPAKLTEWGEKYPEGIFCSNGRAGCVPVAMAQAFAILEKPTKIALGYSTNETINLDWTEIKKHKKSSADAASHTSCTAGANIHNTIAHLCRQLGYISRANYQPGITLAAKSEAVGTLQYYLGPSKVESVSVEKFSKSTFFDKLYKNKGIALMFGLNDNGGGHCWLCEGGRHYEYHNSLTLIGEREFVSNTYYFYYNWGECGDYNGYYLGDVYDTDKGMAEEDLPKPVNPVYDLSNPFSASRGYNFKNSIECVILYK